MAVWTLEIGGLVRKYKTFTFDRKLKKGTPAKFSGQVEYDVDNLINYFDLIEAKRDGITEWKGFIEGLEVEWSADGRYYNIDGRDTTIILWKKYIDDFSSMHEGTEGFFGKVNAVELIKFLLRTPQSDPTIDYPDNKSGWGLDYSRMPSVTAAQTSYGDPEYTILRRRGIGWFNSGNPFNNIQRNVDELICGAGAPPCGAAPAWNTFGVGDPVFLSAEDNNYIHSNTQAAQAEFGFADLPANATAVNNAFLTVVWRPHTTWNPFRVAMLYVLMSFDGGTTYERIGEFGGREAPWHSNPWRHFTFDISGRFESIEDLRNDNPKLRLVCASDALIGAPLGIDVTHAYLTISYVTGGSQSLCDWFGVAFDEEEIVGVYIESRFDEDSYPRNYDIVTVDTILRDFLDGTWTEVDPNLNITILSSTHIDFQCRQDEDAYYYTSLTSGLYFRHTGKITVMDDPLVDDANDDAYPFYAVTQQIDDLRAIELLNGPAIALAVCLHGGVPVFRLTVMDGAGGAITFSPELTETSQYSFEIERICQYVYCRIYNPNGTLFYEFGPPAGTFVVNPNVTFDYYFTAMTWNNGDADQCDLDLDDYAVDEDTVLVSVNGNTYRDIIHSWTPRTMTSIKIKITSPHTGNGWAISQIYIYKAEDCDYRVWNETGCTPSFSLDQYIRHVIIPNYSQPLGPINIPRGRLIDVINSVVEKLHSGYQPYAWWLNYDANNTFVVANRKGADISGLVDFSLGTHIEGSTNKGEIDETVQKVKVLGMGQGKRQEKAGSKWIADTAAMAQVNTFYEEVIPQKEIAGSELAELVADIYLQENADPLEKISVKISYDTYNAMTYDVGDDVTINDALTRLIAAIKRIYNINKTVDSNGEHVVLYLGSPHKEVEDEWGEIYRRLKKIEINDTVVGDWSPLTIEVEKVDPKKLATLFEKTAQNDEIPVGDDKTNAKWVIGGDGVNGMLFMLNDDRMAFYGPTIGAGIQMVAAEMLRDVPNTGAGYAADFAVTGNDSRYALAMHENPKMVCEMKLWRCDGCGTPINWANGDIFEIGFRADANDVVTGYVGTNDGYWFRLEKLTGNTFSVHARWEELGENTESEKYICEIDMLKKYRFEILTDKYRRWVIFNVYDVESERVLPHSVVATHIDVDTIVSPFWGRLSADNTGADPNIRAIVYIYRVKVECERVQE